MSIKTFQKWTKANGSLEWQIGEEKHIATDIFLYQQGSNIVIDGMVDDKHIHFRIDSNTPDKEMIFDRQFLRYVEHNAEFCSSAHTGRYRANLDNINKSYNLWAELEFFGYSEIFHITLDINA